MRERRRHSQRTNVRYALMLALALISTFGAWKALETSYHVSRDEHRACAVMRDIHALLTIPQPKGERPPPPAARVLLSRLDRDLAVYLVTERRHPGHRGC